MKNSYTSLSIAINELKKLGYTIDFNLLDHGISCSVKQKTWKPEQLNVVKYYRFEGPTDPGDNSILFVIETEDGHKGLLVDAYGAESGEISKEMMEKLRIHN
ncbi:MAG TPA: phosphoribosylpyrophosphate synthetase [Flavobacteriaceae bacterium]|nr:phosphoribosylpyrophosphate synthetase [Flavobacteriaceae bacterium]